MSDLTADGHDLREQLARIDKLREETLKYTAEQHKLLAEQQKFGAEQLKLAAEAAKLSRDRVLSPWVTAVGAIGGIITLSALILRAFDIIH